MHRITRVLLLFLSLGYLVMPISAQDMLIVPAGQYNLLLKEDALFQISMLEPNTYSLLFENRACTDMDELRDNYLQWPRLALLRIEQSRIQEVYNGATGRNVFRTLYNKPKVNEEKMIREEWSRILGTDVWFPYYKAKEVEDWVRERFSFRIFKLKGTPRFEKHEIVYTFKTNF